jgi:hypothetical protein
MSTKGEQQARLTQALKSAFGYEKRPLHRSVMDPKIARHVGLDQRSLESTKVIVATALMISKSPTIEVAFNCSERNTTELSRPITGTSNSVNEVVTAGKARETVTKAQKGNAVVSGPL